MESLDPDPDTANILPQILLIIVLTAVNAFFAAAELAVVSANKNKIKRLAAEGNKKARKVEKLAEDETKFLSTIQVGITLAGFFSSATASVTLSEGFGKALLSVGVPYGDTVAMIIITLILSYITLIFGELLPKRIALRNPEKTSMDFAGVLLVVRTVATPFVKLLSGTCELLARLFRIDRAEEEKVSDEDIIDVVTEGVSDGSIGEDKQELIESTLEFYHLNAADIMTPRVDLFMIDIDDDPKLNIEKIISEKYTRIPVYKDTIDNIIGVINAKDILASAHENGFDGVDLKSLIRLPFFAREFIDTSELFNQMKRENQQLAFLVDEFGGLSGIVTVEDLVEVIVGDINDEFDENVDEIKRDADGFTVSGNASVHDVNDECELHLDDENTEYDTVSGLVVYEIGHIPQADEKVEIKVSDARIKVLKVADNRISKVKITKIQE